jgi:flagellar biosynthetic protein FliQ
MTGDLALQLFAQALWVAVVVSAPVLGVTLAVGLVISVLQAVTQVQDMSLMFIPKLLSAVIVLVLFGPWMLKRMTTYAIQLISSAPQYL